VKIPRGLVGSTVGPLTQDIDARWLMAYAAGLGETDSAYLDTLRPGSLLAHPLFPVCYEWPLAVESRARQLGDEVALRGVHATHDLTLHRPPRAGDRLTTTATVIAVAPRRAGAYVLTRYESRDARGERVSTTDYGSVYLGVACDPEGALPPPPPLSPSPLPRGGEGQGEGGEGDWDEWTEDIPIPATLAHVYTECARIWNPIHTDPEVAKRAGLPRIILHGTATLALSISAAMRRGRGPAGTRATRVACRFTGMVPLPSRLSVHGRPDVTTGAAARVRFHAVTPDGGVALADGCLETS
jgi:acyl dehydratase